MTIVELLALIDGVTAMTAHVSGLIDQAKKDGLITKEQQAQLAARMESNRSKIGL